MASKFMANAAFEARLLLRPSHQRTVWTVNKLKRPIPGRPTLPPILSSRSYSDSTPTPPLSKTSGSTESSQSSGPADKTYSESTPTPPLSKTSGSTESSQSPGPEDKNWFPPKVWVKGGTAWALTWALTGALGLGGALLTVGTGFTQYVSQETWKDQREASQRRERESARESAIYNKLKEGPVFQEAIEHPIPRKALVEVIRRLIIPAEKHRLYPLIIGEHGTGKISLIKLAVNSMDKPKGVVYVNIPLRCDLEDNVTKAMQEALGWSPDPVIDSKEPVSLEEVLQVLSHHAIKYKQEYNRLPVLIIDNANKLAQKQQGLLDLFQDYAKNSADNGIITVVFVSSEGRVPRRMMQRASWSRRGRIIEIGDVSKEEALEYLKLRKIDEKQAAQIYKLIGGRMVHLESIADDIETNGTLEDLRKTMFSEAESQLDAAEILPTGRYHKEGVMILRELLKNRSISRHTFYGLAGRDTGNKLLETNIFAFHFNSQEITFQSTVMKRYCEENPDVWESGLKTRT